MATSRSTGPIRQPLLLKLFFVFLGTGILLLSLVAGYLVFFSSRATEPRSHFLSRGLQKCTASLAAEIGYPPNLEHARDLSTQLGLDINISSPKGDIWKSSDEVHPKSQRSYKVTQKEATYTFYLQKPSSTQSLLRDVMWLIAALFVVLLVSFLVIKWLFRPLTWLMDGVQAISEGKLDYQVSLRKGDEFESLGTAFNQMTNKVSEMVKAREQLLSDLSHELRSPLTRMQVSTEFVEKAELKESLKEDLREMEDMVREVLEGARLNSPHGSLNKVKVDLKALLQQLVSRYESIAPGINFNDLTLEGRWDFWGDEELIKRALRNLIENALKYSALQPIPVEVSLNAHETVAEVVVRDYGIGIPSGEQTLIFEPFYRVDKSRTRSTGGYGLGLNLCKKIIEAHGGTITLESSLGLGTRFIVTLPISRNV